MSELIKTLHKKGDASTEIYPNIKTNNIPDGAVTTTKIADNSVTTAKISDGAVTTAKISDGAVSSAKLEDGAVSNTKIADGSVSSVKLEDGAVTTTKINDDAVTEAKIQNGAVTTNKVSDGSITYNKLHNNLKELIGIALHRVTVAFTYNGHSWNVYLDIYSKDQNPFNTVAKVRGAMRTQLSTRKDFPVVYSNAIAYENVNIITCFFDTNDKAYLRYIYIDGGVLKTSSYTGLTVDSVTDEVFTYI